MQSIYAWDWTHSSSLQNIRKTSHHSFLHVIYWLTSDHTILLLVVPCACTRVRSHSRVVQVQGHLFPKFSFGKIVLAFFYCNIQPLLKLVKLIDLQLATSIRKKSYIFLLSLRWIQYLLMYTIFKHPHLLYSPGSVANYLKRDSGLVSGNGGLQQFKIGVDSFSSHM